MGVKHQLKLDIGDEVYTRALKEVAVRDCMARLLKRYDDAAARQLYRPDGELAHHFPDVRDWFKARYDNLCNDLVVAINEDDSIIGKQWHYDHYTKMVRATSWGTR